MEFQFTCDCGEEISDFSRGGSSVDTQITCDCGAVWIATFTRIRGGE